MQYSIKKIIALIVIFIFSGFFYISFTAAAAEEQTHEIENIPWSGYWWPFRQCGLGSGGGYFGHPSPLEKYEIYVTGSYPSELSNWYREKNCDDESLPWTGHCGHWAFASLWENMEILPSTIDNIIFRVGDKKGLLTLLHNKEIAAWGNGANPQVFHYWLMKYIKDEKTGFIVDMDKGDEVWQYPVYKFIMESDTIGTTESVHVTVITADDSVAPDYIGTKNRYYNFYYNLFLNAEEEIVGGEWTGDSLIEHPAWMWATISQRTDAPMLDSEIVRQIAKTKDDSLENGTNNVSLSSGQYNLILLDADNYSLNTDIGSTLILNLVLLEGGGNYLNVELTDKNGEVVHNQEITTETSLNLKFLSENPPYLIKITKDSYETPGIYSILYDEFRENSNTIPYIPKDGNWSGFTITNYSNETLEDIELTSYKKDGTALQTLLGPLSMEPKDKISFLFDNLEYREREYTDIDSVRISSAKDTGIANIISGRKGGVTEIVQGRLKGTHLVIPNTVKERQANYTMFGRIINESDITATAEIKIYDAVGVELKSIEKEFNPRESYEFIPGQDPFTGMPNDGWMEIQSKNGESQFSGFQHILEDSTVEVNFAIPVNSLTKIIPHIPFSTNWKTQLVVINTSDEKSNILLHRVMAGLDTGNDYQFTLEPKERKVVNLHDILDVNPSNPYNQSIVSVSSNQPFVGYYAYEGVSGAVSETDDNVTIPLLEASDFSSSLILPHNTQGGKWDTGVGIFNPGPTPLTFSIKPYEGENRTLITDQTRNVTLNPGQYTVFITRLMFPDHISKITFLEFETEQPNDIIGGFHLYINKEEGICGSNLHCTGE